MVGVPGRSRACAQCKAKRVACDLQQPHCTRCVKARRSCEYLNGHIFVLNQEGTHKTKYRKECALSLSTSAWFKADPWDGRSSELPLEQHPLKRVPPPFTYYNAPSPNKMLQQGLLASGVAYGRCSGPTAFFGIVSSSLVHSANTTLYSPALACYTLWRGRQDGNSTMIDASHQLYLRGLVATQQALTDEKTVRADSTLAACHALGLYEALECPDKSNTAYRWHRTACSRLLRLRGPQAHREGLGHELFVNVRIFAVLEAIERGEPTWLADQEWMTVPWEYLARTEFDKIIDICTLSPSIVVKAHGMKHVPFDQLLPNCLSITADIAALIRKFEAFHSEFVESYKGPQLFWERVEPEGVHVIGEDRVDSALRFNPTLCFSDLDTASMLFMYWSSQVSLWAGLADLYSLASQLCATETFYSTIRSHIGQDIDLSQETMQARWLDMARKVCGSVAFCTTPSALESGPPRIATSLNMLVETLRNRKVCESEFNWALMARQEIAGRWIRLMGVL